jgi:hypothetical protein
MNIGARVAVVSFEGKQRHTGSVEGMGWFAKEGEIREVYLVKLDTGFYDPNGGYVSLLASHADSLKPI